jgi:hypothetical protein
MPSAAVKLPSLPPPVSGTSRSSLPISRLSALPKQIGDAGVLLVGRPVHAAGHRDRSPSHGRDSRCHLKARQVSRSVQPLPAIRHETRILRRQSCLAETLRQSGAVLRTAKVDPLAEI